MAEKWVANVRWLVSVLRSFIYVKERKPKSPSSQRELETCGTATIGMSKSYVNGVKLRIKSKQEQGAM